MNDKREYPFRINAGDQVLQRGSISAENRESAVYQVLQVFWKKYKGRHGFASEAVVVSDPYSEVKFDDSFNCASKRNNYLDEETTARVVCESKGKLERNTKPGIPHHPRLCLRLKKRRRKYLKTIAPNILRSSTGTHYYQVVLQPQKSKKGVVKQKRKMQNVRLDARSLAEAIEEIKQKGLRRQNNIARNLKKRSLKFVSYMAGLAQLGESDMKFFEPVLKSVSRQE